MPDPMTGSAANQAWETLTDDEIKRLAENSFELQAVIASVESILAARRTPTVEEISDVFFRSCMGKGKTMSDLDLDRLAAIAAEATPGPWDSIPAGAWTGRVFAGDHMVAKIDTNVSDQHHDATFIAAFSPDVVAELIAAAKERNNLRETVAAANARIADLERERDLAIAHDRQPYPTAEAYEKVCAARTKWHEKAKALQDRLADVAALADEWELCLHDPKRRVGWSGGAILHDLRTALADRAGLAHKAEKTE